jgi:DNA-binding SARP family transcriptional activator
MAYRTPAVHEGTLIAAADGGERIVVDTDAWFAWLDSATRFGVVVAEGHFTARKERASHGRGGWYWRAYLRQDGRLARVYLGSSEGLSLERLRRTATRLREPRAAASETAPAARSHGLNHETAPPAPPRLHLCLLGDFSLSCGDHQDIEIGSSRMQSLLACLALHPQAGQTRQQLSFLFWPDSTEAQARNNLRQLVHQLRRLWPEMDRWLSIGASRLAWRRAVDLDVDVEAFDTAVAAADQAEQVHDVSTLRDRIVRAVSQYRADLLPGCYEDWITSERERLHEAYARMLDRLIALLEDQRDHAAAIEYAQQRLRHDPHDEDGYRRLMHLHALNGDRVGALRVYHACVTMLGRELGIGPSPATRNAYEGLLSLDTRGAAPGSG